jgi:hypothetical protein
MEDEIVELVFNPAAFVSPENIGHEDSMSLSVAKYTFPLIDGVFTPKLMWSARNIKHQQRDVMIYSENVLLWHPFLVKGDTSDTFEIWQWGLFGMEISILGLQKSLHIVDCLLNSQTPCGKI